MHELVHRARDYATQAHRRIDQRRKYTKHPYEVHLKAVAETVAGVSDDPEVIAAAWLHDTVEDTPATLEDVAAAVGPGVAQLVAEVTDVSRPSDGNRAARKAIDRRHLAKASPRAKTIKLADLIDNCRDICREDLGFARVFTDEMAALLEVLRQGDARLKRRAEEVLEQCRARLKLEAEDQPLYDELAPIDRFSMDQHGRSLRLFARTFTAADIAEPLRSFDVDRPVRDAAAVMQARGSLVAGVREAGKVTSYLRLEGPKSGDCGRHAQPLQRGQVVNFDAPLSDVVHVLTLYEYCFVTALAEVIGIIGRADMEKPVVRMWLFGIISFMEIQLTDRLRARWPDDTWTQHLTPARLAKAEALRQERFRRNQPCELLDCLQLGDKARVLLRDPDQVKAFGFETAGGAKRVTKEVESLRNNLAHGQDIVTNDWPQIARMTQRIEAMLGELERQ